MKKTLLILITFLFTFPLISFSQQWTKEEQEVLDNIEMCWDAWVEAIEKNDVNIFYEKCAYEENASFWWTEDGAPESKRTTIRDWDLIRKTDVKWIDFRPVAVRLYGDVAMVQFYGIWKANTPQGQANTEYKRTEIFIKRDGRWVFIGGQGTPVSARDQQPYK